MYPWWLNTLRQRQNGGHFPIDVYKCICLNENVWISLKISQKFVPKVPINNIPALLQIMAWHHSGDKPLSEPMMVSLLMHICITPPQWVNVTYFAWHSHNLNHCYTLNMITIAHSILLLPDKIIGVNFLFIWSLHTMLELIQHTLPNDL